MSLNYGTSNTTSSGIKSNGPYYSSDVEQPLQTGPVQNDYGDGGTFSSKRTHFIESILVLVAVLNGLGAGIMFIFSNTIMPTLSTLDDSVGMETMATINLLIVNPMFIFIYFGGMFALIPACLMSRSTTTKEETLGGSDDHDHQYVYSKWARYLAWAAFIIHFFGCVLITVTQNVPRNDELQRLVSEFGSNNNGEDANVSDEASEFWRNNYLTQWVAWNTARTIFGILSSVAAILCLRATRRPFP